MFHMVEYKKIRDFYITEVENNFLPYWLGYVDEEYGGLLPASLS